MEESRSLIIFDKRFSRADLLAIIDIFLDQAERAQRNGIEYLLTFTLACADGTTYSSSDPEMFHEGQEIDLKQPEAVSFIFREYGGSERVLSFHLAHGGGYHDEVAVSGKDRDWVRAIFVLLNEKISSIAPSKSWFTRYSKLTIHLVFLGWGTIIHLGFTLLAEFVFQYQISISNLLQELELRIFFLWWFRYVLGILGGGIYVSKWLLKAWPSIDLDVGPNYQKTLKMQRERVKFVLIGIALPILVALIVDILNKEIPGN